MLWRYLFFTDRSTQETPGRKHVAFDGWTAANAATFIGLMLYLILNGELRAILLDYIPIDTAHSGRDIAEHVHAAIVTYGLESSVSLLFLHFVSDVLTNIYLFSSSVAL